MITEERKIELRKEAEEEMKIFEEAEFKKKYQQAKQFSQPLTNERKIAIAVLSILIIVFVWCV